MELVFLIMLYVKGRPNRGNKCCFGAILGVTLKYTKICNENKRSLLLDTTGASPPPHNLNPKTPTAPI